LKTDRLLKWCSSAGRLFRGFSTVSAKKHLRTSARQWLGEEFVSMTSWIVGSAGKCEKSHLDSYQWVQRKSCKSRLRHVADVDFKIFKF